MVGRGDKGLLPQAFSTIPGTGVTVGRKAEESLAQGLVRQVAGRAGAGIVYAPLRRVA
jgi:hypothetical protein